MAYQAYNPLDKIHLVEDVVRALLARPVIDLPPSESVVGAGLYALYYAGDFSAYQRVAELNRHNAWEMPIYVGKAVPAGARKGGYGLGAASGEVLYRRLCEHAVSIQQTTNLALSDFRCRYLIVDDIWIPPGESLLIAMFVPLWNHHLDGFGSNDLDSGRYNQRRSAWDEIHPGRPWAAKLRPAARSQAEILQRIVEFLQTT
jgi:Eco29kI restriction endonuclease